MALNNTYFESNKVYEPLPIPESPGYVPPSPPEPPTPGSGSTPVIPRPTFTGNVSVQFYINHSDDDTLDKNITAYGSGKSVTIKEACDILHFMIPFNDTSLIGVNYAEVNGRYYYCHPVMDAGQLTGIRFDNDALMNNRSAIRALSAIVDRTGANFNTYLSDPKMAITAYTTMHTLEATSGFSQSLNYYLLTIGDKGGV